MIRRFQPILLMILLPAILCFACGRKEETADADARRSEMQDVDAQVEKLAKTVEDLARGQAEIQGQQQAMRNEMEALIARSAALSRASSSLQFSVENSSKSVESLAKDLNVLREHLSSVRGERLAGDAPAHPGRLWSAGRILLAILIVIGLVAAVLNLGSRVERAEAAAGQQGREVTPSGNEAPLESVTPYGSIRIFGAAKGEATPEEAPPPTGPSAPQS